MSPEIWKGDLYSSKCDIYSLGCLIFELSTLKHPYEARSTHELEKKVLRRKTPSISSYYSSELNYIIKKCLIKNPEDRPSAVDLLNHTIIIWKMAKYKFSFDVKVIKNT